MRKFIHLFLFNCFCRNCRLNFRGYFLIIPYLLVAKPADSQPIDGERLTREVLMGILEITTSSGSSGTGFIIGKEGSTYVVTNLHVVAGSRKKFGSDNSGTEISLTNAEGQSFRCLGIYKSSSQYDLALLRFSNPGNYNFRILPILPEGEEPMASEIATIGNPFGDKFSYSQGIVSKSSYQQEDFLARTNMPLNPGNSGGPVLNKFGQVVGVVVSRVNFLPNGGKLDIAQGFNFYINAATLRSLLKTNQVDYDVNPLILRGELTPRKLSEAEEVAIINSNLELIKAQHEKKLADIQRENEAERVKREQIIQLEKQNRELEQARIQYDKERERIRIEQEKERLANEKTARKTAEKERRRRLPPRLSLRMGAGAQLYGGDADRINAVFSEWSMVNPPIVPHLQGSFGYLFDVTHKPTSLNVFVAGGKFNNSQINYLLKDFPDINIDGQSGEFLPFTEIEAGFIFNEWFRISAGKGNQIYTKKVNPLNYHVITTGFTIPGKTVEPDLLVSALVGGDRAQIGFRMQLILNLHFRFARF